MLSFGRRRFVSLIRATSIAALAAVDAYAQTGRMYRVGVLETVSADQNRDNLDALLRGLRERGYVEGQNLRLEYRSADGRADRFLHEEDRRPSLEDFDFGELISRSQAEENRPRSKSEIIDFLRAEGERSVGALDQRRGVPAHGVDER